MKPEPDYGLFIRFKDTRFFEQVFIDCGAVAWPGEIDLAPDAMYAQVANQRHESQQVGPGESQR